jgi:hypothetical protein
MKKKRRAAGVPVEINATMGHGKIRAGQIG